MIRADTPSPPSPTPSTTIALVEQLDKANSLFHMALNEDIKRRKELLEQAFRAYVDILPLLQGNEQSIMLVRRTVLSKIHAIEALIEQEIERSVISNNSSSSSNSSSSNSSTTTILEKEDNKIWEAWI